MSFLQILCQSRSRSFYINYSSLEVLEKRYNDYRLTRDAMHSFYNWDIFSKKKRDTERSLRSSLIRKMTEITKASASKRETSPYISKGRFPPIVVSRFVGFNIPTCPFLLVMSHIFIFLSLEFSLIIARVTSSNATGRYYEAYLLGDLNCTSCKWNARDFFTKNVE